MRIVFAGTPETALPSFQALVASRHDVVAVVTRPDAPAGRGRTLTPSPVALAAEAHGIEVLKPAKPSDPDFMARLRELAPDCVPIVAYGALIRREALDIPPYGWINLHFSVLPAWRGAAPVQRAIMAGDEVTGATVFSLVEELDAGPVLGTITELIRADDTTAELLERLADWGSKLLVDVVDHIEDGDIAAVPQPADNISFAPKLSTDEARIDWDRPAFAIDRHIRGCTPAPGAWTTLAGERVKIGPATIADDSTLAPGRIEVGKREVRVGTATTDLVLGEVQAVGKKRMAAADWGRGTTFEDGATFA
ncbi:methionyl-tRNA formyltransferase [Aeromicrobium fastidiosum]|uniref:Methionyl-tRNA formyltransferase n=1 Tax=Aeromicrobium fastidiosum TaxID=52699 RepID=A0A641AMN4_9ACTN|nr:methionyl-tRNA formyltransferase [Aeromicrobium fastidiosum]KAA1376184.1 methionyl-tRNA formyltransferase [Aeromicrobium fastidiosum]MBP2391929.1 methionyl-tRNA formyltransferase [Aeromicrobium fastidiosum]